MATFIDVRAQLSKQRYDRDRAAAQLNAEREQLKSVRREISAVQRVDGSTGARGAALAALEDKARALTGAIEAGNRQVAALSAGAAQLLGQLAGLSDPTQQIEQLSDAFPILLFPVRIETRFQKTSASGAPASQLWVRFYPDDCQVDSFEAMLTDPEIQNARSFWLAMWRAGGIEAQRRGAWRFLVGASGSGRASYITE